MTGGRFLLATGFVLFALVVTGCGSGAKPPGATAAVAKPSKLAAAGPTNAQLSAALARFAAKHRPIYCGGRAKPWVAFTFDDGPGPYTKRAAKVLRHFHAPATFFLVGRNVAPFKSSIAVERRRGPLGDHSWSHPFLPNMSAGEINSQIVSTSAAIRHVIGKRVALFRPPYGARNADVDRVVHHERMATILWNVDSRDSLGAGHKEISRRVIAGMQPGSIILMHENHGQTIRALRYSILPHVRRTQMKLVTVPQMLAANPPTDAQLAKGRKGCAYHAP